MDVVERFRALMAGAPEALTLDEPALLIAARARGASAVDIGASLAELDALARGCAHPTFDGVRRHLFEREGFRGNTLHYDDPANSFLDQVLDRRLGIPITLSVVMIEVARRVGVHVVGIGMPAHFIVRAGDADVYCDPFGGGRLLDADGCEALFARVTRGALAFEPSSLAPVGAPQVLSRMLANLEHGPYAADPLRLAALLDLHLMVPGLGAGERVALASRLANIGRFEDAAGIVESGAGTPALRQQARAFRSRLN
jgi:hypothetical protein